jgi:hypothetical protein
MARNSIDTPAGILARGIVRAAVGVTADVIKQTKMRAQNCLRVFTDSKHFDATVKRVGNGRFKAAFETIEIVFGRPCTSRAMNKRACRHGHCGSQRRFSPAPGSPSSASTNDHPA